jgi:SAM-dependent methyltransferase
MGSVGKDEVKAFWEAEACGERYGAEQDRLRYEMEPEIVPFADFESAAGKRVLEIGVGMGADFLRWARAGAHATGIDLTDRAVALTRQRLVEEGLEADVRVADAESLPFPDGHFDIVYSWGVLHHSPDPVRALGEAQRVLAPGGQLKLMLYHRHSWVAIAAWVRFCLVRGKPLASLGNAVAHVESPGTHAFTPTEVRAILSVSPDLSDITISPTLTRWDRRWAPVAWRLGGPRYGWFLLIEAYKVDHRNGDEAASPRARPATLTASAPTDGTLAPHPHQ